MPPITAYARCISAPHASFQPTTIVRRDPEPHDLVIEISFCGICHTDLHYARDEFGRTTFPLVPGHEIAGTVLAVGPAVTRFAIGDRVGIGVMVDSCRECDACQAGTEQYCKGKRTLTYNSIGRDGQITHGGYSQRIVVDERYVVRIPDAIPLKNAAPLLCAGITLYSPLRHWGAGPGRKVGIIGFGGLGHLGVQIARAMGARITVFDVDERKREDALRLGAMDFRLSSDPQMFSELDSSLDLIVSTVPVSLDLDAWLRLLTLNGALVNTGVPSKSLSVNAISLLDNRRSLAGTRSGGIAETQEMMEFCAAHGIKAEIEVIHADRIDEAYARMERGDVRFRFVIDASTFAAET